MHQTIEIGRPFSLKVPNGRRQNIKVVLGNVRKPTVSVIGSHRKVKTPTLTINPVSTDNEYSGAIEFHENTPIGERLEMVAYENGAYFNHADQAALEKAQSFRQEIQSSYDNLYPEFNLSKACTFDSSAWTRSIGQIQIANQLERKLGHELYKEFPIFAGCGLGVIQALHFANGGNAGTLAQWWLSKFKKSLGNGISTVLGDQRRSY
jgi:hypothetical protein